MSKQQNKRKNRLFFGVATIIVLIIVSIIIQKYFMPEWVDGNTNHPQPADTGVHEQLNSGQNESGQTLNIF